MDGDPLGNLTYFNENLGASAVDYSICSQNFFKYISNFMTLPQNELSDHCKIVTEIKGGLNEYSIGKDNYDWKNLDKNFIWDENCKENFIKFFEGANHEISEINQRIEAGLVNSTGKKIQELYQNAAKSTFSSKTKINQNTKSRKTNSKLWFDTECKSLKTEVRKLGRYKHKHPENIFLRERYCSKMKDFRRKCQTKRFSFWKEKLEIIENSLTNSKLFWENWKKCSETIAPKLKSNIKGKQWFEHFSKLHNETGIKQITQINDNVTPNILNDPFTEDELSNVINSLKTKKATGIDKISNEMIKSSPNKIRSLLLKYVNICLKNTLVPGDICYELLTPILKEGTLNDHENYRGLCVSSVLLKLICSLINNRILDFVEKNNLLSKNQIGFKKKCRTSDHLLTLKSLVKKHVTIGKKKLYVCFVDLKKAFDSVWHKGLFYKIQNIGINGNILELIQNIYKKTKCAVKVDNKITEFFSYSKGVRQGCPLSPILFNLFVNDIFQMIDNNTPNPLYLNENNPLNVLMYADDLIMIAESEAQLQKKMTLLNNYCMDWNLQINKKKTKTMVFNRGNKLCNTNIYLNNNLIECVKEFKYLGFTISAKNCSFLKTLSDLKIKANRAIFALNNKIKLSKLPTELTIKLFNSQIRPILLYGSEVWAPYSNFNYDNWDNTEIEQCHTQFLKRALGCNIQSPNLMIRAEVGQYPLLTDIINRSVGFLKHVNESESTLAKYALLYELENNIDNNDDNNILQLVE